MPRLLVGDECDGKDLNTSRRDLLEMLRPLVGEIHWNLIWYKILKVVKAGGVVAGGIALMASHVKGVADELGIPMWWSGVTILCPATQAR
jgi:hypothetical protein